MGRITKAVIPAAGLGTRLLPATKAVPKEMLPVFDKPAVQYVVEEAVSSGLQHVLMVTGRNKAVLENHFDRAVEIESNLVESGDAEKLDAVEIASNLADIHFVRQGNPLGLGHAVSKAQTFVGNEPFAVMLPDDLIKNGQPLMNEMIAFAEDKKVNVVALMAVDQSEIGKYGIADINISTPCNQFVEINRLIEKPSPGETSSNLAIIGRYVLQPEVFAALIQVQPGKNGEIQLTDALNVMAADPELAGPVYGFIFTGDRFDVGTRFDLMKSSVLLALEDSDLGPLFQNWLKKVVLGAQYFEL